MRVAALTRVRWLLGALLVAAAGEHTEAPGRAAHDEGAEGSGTGERLVGGHGEHGHRQRGDDDQDATERLAPVSRLGGDEWGRPPEGFQLIRPE